MAGYLNNTTDCDHCENEHTKPNKGCMIARHTHKEYFGMSDADEYVHYSLHSFDTPLLFGIYI